MPTIIHRPKFREKLFFFISGAIISTPFPILVDSLANYFLLLDVSSFWATLISVALLAPFMEEFAKAYPLFYRHGETEKSLVSLGFLTGLGFGIVEFLVYIFLYHVPVIVRIPALFFHATNTSIVSYGIAKNKPVRFYLIAVGFHFLNNFSALFGNWWYAGGSIALLGSYTLAIYLNRKSLDKTIDHWVQEIS